MNFPSNSLHISYIYFVLIIDNKFIISNLFKYNINICIYYIAYYIK